MIKGLISTTTRLASALFIVSTIAACGGGGGSDSGSGFIPAPPPEGANLDVTLGDANGNTITEITPLKAGLFRVVVTAPDGNPLPQEVVTGEASLGTLQPESGTALTDDDGAAVFIIQPDGLEGAGTLTVSVTYDGVESSTTFNYGISTQLPFTLAGEFQNGSGETVSRVDTGERVTLQVTLTDDRLGIPIRNQTVTAEIGDLGTLAPALGSVTDQAGQATFTIDVSDLPGLFPVTFAAVVPGGSVTGTVDLNVGQAIRKLGHINADGEFVEGEIGIVPDGQLSPGGTAVLALAVVDENGELVSTQESVSIESSCLFGALAVLDPDSPVTMGNRIAVDYTLQGCVGEDVITATLASSGAQATGAIFATEPRPDDAAQIIFSGAMPELIALRGTGSASDIAEFANVSFNVIDGGGTPVPNARVNFELVQTAGGLALECADSSYCLYETSEDAAQSRSRRDTTQSDTDGEASTRVLSGAIASPVQVLAYVDINGNGERDPNEPATTSKTLVVSTGLPDQNSISLSASVLNVEGAYETDGRTSDITVRMADTFNNPAPDGTAAVFSTELGSIIGSCTTIGGSCTVTWASQSPRGSAIVEQYSSPITIDENLNSAPPNRYDCPSHRENHGPCPDDIGDPAINPPGAPRGGRSTILVTASGEESFIDRNANGRYDEGEFWTNLTEAFIDHNEDDLYTPDQRSNCSDPATADDVCLAGFEETFVDRNVNGIFDLNNSPSAPSDSSLPSGQFNGVLCRQADAETGVCSRELINVRDSLVLVNSFSDASNFDIMVINSSEREPSSLLGDQFFIVYVSDIFNNPPPAGSTISFEGSGECEALTEVPPISDTNKAGAYAAALAVQTNDFAQSLEEAANSAPDQLTVKLTLPNGSFITETYACRVDRCADNPNDFPNFSPSPPQCGQ